MTVVSLSLGSLACGSSSDAPAPMNTGGTMSTGGTVAGGGAAGTTAGAGAGGVATGGTAGSGIGGGGSGGAGSGCTPLMPTGTARQLVISEVVPAMGIEVFNPGTAPVAIDMIWFCSQYDYAQTTAPSGKTEVAPGAYVALAWPEGSGYDLATVQGGEMLMMINDDGAPTPDTVQSYVCWGDHTGGRKGDTTSGAATLYMGDCAPAMTAGSLSRKPGTDGLGAASYDATVAPSLADCP